MADAPETMKLAFEVPTDLAEELVREVSQLAIAHKATIELTAIYPRCSQLAKRWESSDEDLFTEVTDVNGTTEHIVSINNLSAFAEKNNVNGKGGLATTIINRLGRELDDRAKERYLFSGIIDLSDEPEEIAASKKRNTGIKVITIQELVDKLKSGEIKIKYFSATGLNVDMLHGYCRQLFAQYET